MGVAAQTACSSARAYQSREAERSLVHRIVARELDAFLADAAARGHPLPRFVETTMRDFLACGLFEYGFVTLQCTDCGTRRAAASRGASFCGACSRSTRWSARLAAGGWRMAMTGAVQGPGRYRRLAYGGATKAPSAQHSAVVSA